MNKIINKFLLTVDTFMPELHLKQPGFTYSACGPLAKHRERIKKFKESGNLKHLYGNELGKSYFAHDAAYSESKDLAKRTIAGTISKNRSYEIARNHGHDVYQMVLAKLVYKFFDKKTRSGGIATSKAGVSVNQQIAEDLHKPEAKKIKKRKVYARFKDNIWAADLAEMESLSSKNKNVNYLLCFIGIFTKYAWVEQFER